MNIPPLARRLAAPGPVAVAVFAVALALRLHYIRLFPVMPLGDSYGRLLYAPQLVQGVWLPGYQLPMAALVAFTRDLAAFRALNAAEGAAACGAVALLFGRALGAWAGALAGLLLAVSPVYIQSAMGLYQEGLFVALAAAGVALALSPSRGWAWLGVATLGAAAMTRYEGWFVVALVSLWLLWESRPGPRGSGEPGALAEARSPWLGRAGGRARLVALLVMGSGPALWLAWNRGLSPHGARSLSPGAGLGRWAEQLGYFEALFPRWIGWGLPVLAALGLVALPFTPRRWRPVALGVGALGALHFALLTLARPYAPPDNWRQLHIPLAVLALFACVGAWALARALGILGRRLAGRLPAGGPPSPSGAASLEGRQAAPGAVPGLAAAAMVPILALALAPPWRMMSSAPRWYGRGPVAQAAQLGEAARPLLKGGGRMLVLGGSLKDAEAGECQAAAVFAQLPRDRLICGHELGDVGGDAQAVARWLGDQEVVAVVWLAGFEELTPAHAYFKSWRRIGDPPYAQERQATRGSRLVAIDQGALGDHPSW